MTSTIPSFSGNAGYGGMCPITLASLNTLFKFHFKYNMPSLPQWLHIVTHVHFYSGEM